MRIPGLVSAALVLMVGAAHGQTPGCPYDSCALRLESRWLSGSVVVRGRGGETVATVGFMGTELARAVAGSDSARVHAEKADRELRLGSLWQSIGIVLARVTVGVALHQDQPRVIVLAIPGFGVSAVGLGHTLQGQSEVERAIWWYNRDLGR